MSKKYKGKVCVYCAVRKSDTADHVVAREFFPDTHRDDLPKAPACQSCNRGKADLERKLTALLPFGSGHEAAVKTLLAKGRRRLEKNPELRRTLQRGQHRVSVLHEGVPASTLALPFAGGEFVALCGLILRGLIWHEWSHVVPSDYFVEVFTVTDHGLPFFQRLLQMSPEHRRTVSVARGAFQYSCTRNSEDAAFTVWHIRFYETLNLAGQDERGSLLPIHVYGLTGPQEVRSMVDQLKTLRLGTRPSDLASK